MSTKTESTDSSGNGHPSSPDVCAAEDQIPGQPQSDTATGMLHEKMHYLLRTISGIGSVNAWLRLSA